VKRQPFPLQWPDGWARAKNRSYPKFVNDFTKDRDAVIRRLGRRGTNVVITSQLPIGSKGLPYIAPVSDPGIAVYWAEVTRDANNARQVVERVIACDRWHRIADNMRAISKSLEALDGLERWGSSQVVERAFAGFHALPPGSSSSFASGPVKRPWRDVIGGVWPDGLDSAATLAVAKLRYRAAISKSHPDHGGAVDEAAELNAAMAEAEVELA